MTIDQQAANKLWQEFRDRWPIDTIKSMTLEQYAQVGNGDTFTQWLEQRTKLLGNIGGLNSFKFGIYQWKSRKETRRGRTYDDKYAWYSKYGDTAEGAFEKVRSIVVDIAKAATEERYEDISDYDLPPTVKWKIAFLYQSKENPKLLPIYQIEALQLLTESHSTSNYELSQKLLSNRGETSFFIYAEQLWNKRKIILDQNKFKPEQALEYLQDKFEFIKDPTKYIAGFETDNGREIGLEREREDVELFVEPGDWADRIPNVSLKKKYGPQDTRNSNLGANAPRLSVGNPAELIKIPTLTALEEFCDLYAQSTEDKPENQMKNSNIALNTILYGPPGTGKTFKTAQLAVEICDGQAPLGSVNDPTGRKALMSRYEELRRENRISFVTFHQAYGYEEFVEGLRPEIVDGQITYSIRKGIFREACDAARLHKLVSPGLKGKPIEDREIYKISLGRAGTAEGKQVLQSCLEAGFLVLGWGGNIDFSQCSSKEEVLAKSNEEESHLNDSDSHATYVTRFKIEAKVGDIVVVSQGNSKFCAIGEITGEYEFIDPPVAGRFHQSRKVRWLAIFEETRKVVEIYDRGFSQQSLYKLDHSGINFAAISSLINHEVETESVNHVLIIDEINRANISKVFGELITLIEPDKRQGEVNAISLKLPYSSSDEPFCVPPNLYIVGTMNTADRSIALMDTALRRRFDFEELQPDYKSISDLDISGINIGTLLEKMNERIEYLYDRDHTIGHAYFIGLASLDGLDRLFRRKIIPLLQEYFHEDWSKIKTVLNDKADAFIIADLSVPSGIENESLDQRTRYRLSDTSFSTQDFMNIYQ